MILKICHVDRRSRFPQTLLPFCNVLFFFVVFWLLAVEGTWSEEPTDFEGGRSVVRDSIPLKAMMWRARSLSAQVEQNKIWFDAELVEPALLRYSEPTRGTIDATLWAWQRKARPIALLSITQEENFPGEKFTCEFVSVATEPVSVSGKTGWRWSPQESSMEWKPVPDAPEVGNAASLRIRQMKDLARRFTAAGEYGEERRTLDLRRMDRPVHRYADPDDDVIDGAIFVFASGTNPEALLLLECRQEQNGTAAMRFGFARMSAGAIRARLDGDVVWSCAAIADWDSTQPYFSVFGNHASIFGADAPGSGE